MDKTNQYYRQISKLLILIEMAACLDLKYYDDQRMLVVYE